MGKTGESSLKIPETQGSFVVFKRGVQGIRLNVKDVSKHAAPRQKTTLVFMYQGGNMRFD